MSDREKTAPDVPITGGDSPVIITAEFHRMLRDGWKIVGSETKLAETRLIRFSRCKFAA